ncbi:MAG: DUF1934 domain-containing protein [Clostridiales bacterium]|nr:DUF1934 domain-containing protein [Clostridiales bacterium]
MTKDVIISIRGAQEYEGTDNDAVQLMTAGQLTQMADGYELSYQESEVTGMEGTTTFQIQGPRVTLLRTGTVCSQMVFEEGRRHLSLYSTPYGNLEVGIATSRLDSSISPTGGNLEIDYSIEIDHALAGYNCFRISVKEDQAALKQGGM